MGGLPSKNVLTVDRVKNVPAASRQQIEDSTLVTHTTPQNQAIDTAPHPPRLGAQPSHVACHPEGQFKDVVHLSDDADDRQQGLRSPVTRLPPETLAQIFELYVIPVEKLTFGGVRTHGPSRLAQVCQHWKAVAESDPHLWTSIQFYFPESHEDHTVTSVQTIFDRHLNRSGALPVSLTFTDHRTYQSGTEELVSLLVRQLRTHERRWRRISLHLSGAFFPQLFAFTQCDLSNLEYLSITGDVFPQSVTLHLNLESATNLKSFTYSGPGPSAEDMICLHWERLDELSLEFAPHYGSSYTVSQQFMRLALCQNITTCSLGIDCARLRLHGTQPILLPCLQTLRVRRLSPLARAGTVIDFLVLPQLQTLEIDASALIGWNQRWHSRNFSGLLARSRCSLLHLSIQDVGFPNDELVRCLALSPALLSFRFIPCPRSQGISSVIRKMDISRISTTGAGQSPEDGQQPTPNPAPLVPQLREIMLASSTEGCLDSMTTMLRSRVGPRARAAGIASLRRIGLVFFDMWHETGVDRVRSSDHRCERVARFQAELEQWMSENDNEDALEVSVAVDSPYLPEYVNI